MENDLEGPSKIEPLSSRSLRGRIWFLKERHFCCDRVEL